VLVPNLRHVVTNAAALATLLKSIVESERQTRLAIARSALGAAAFEAAWAAGRALALGRAVEAALSLQIAESGRAEAGPAPGPLTEREEEVARLVARRLGNREIAEELVISHRTGERHVENIRGKLGVHARAEIVSWMTRREALLAG
jgi:DNA-binding NarL/FixJ family response regulator